MAITIRSAQTIGNGVKLVGNTANYLNTGTSLSTAQFEQVLAIVASSTTSLALQLDTLGTAFETANTQAESNYTHLVGLISSSTASVATKISILETGFTAVNWQLVNISYVCITLSFLFKGFSIPIGFWHMGITEFRLATAFHISVNIVVVCLLVDMIWFEDARRNRGRVY